jgi:hypothetical protein
MGWGDPGEDADGAGAHGGTDDGPGGANNDGGGSWSAEDLDPQDFNQGWSPADSGVTVGPQKAPSLKGGFEVGVHPVQKMPDVPDGPASGGTKGMIGQSVANIAANPLAAAVAAAVPFGSVGFGVGVKSGLLDEPVAGVNRGGPTTSISAVDPNTGKGPSSTSPDFGTDPGDVQQPRKYTPTRNVASANNSTSLAIDDGDLTRNQLRTARRQVTRFR